MVEKVKVLSLSKYTSPEPLGNGQGHFEKGHFPEIKWDSNCLNLRIKVNEVLFGNHRQHIQNAEPICQLTGASQVVQG